MKEENNEPVWTVSTAKAKKEYNLKTLQICKEYQHNIKESEQLRIDILKSLEADPIELFLKAVKAISLMTNDKNYYEAIKKHFK